MGILKNLELVGEAVVYRQVVDSNSLQRMFNEMELFAAASVALSEPTKGWELLSKVEKCAWDSSG